MGLELPAKSFKLIGGALSLDFTNTVGGRDQVKTRKALRDAGYRADGEKINGYADLAAWSRDVGLATETEARRLLKLAEERPEAAEAVLVRGRALREAIYRIFKSVAEGWPPEGADLEKLNEELAIAKGHETLVYSAGAFNWAWRETSAALDKMLWPVARSAADLLTSGDLARVRQCGGENCGWLFLDTSRNKSRHWCDMKDCGNLAKVRRFRRRRQEAP